MCCCRYVSPDETAIVRCLDIGARDSGRWIRPNYNVAPTAIVPIVRLDIDGETEVVPARWGLIPNWWTEERPPFMAFNARSEEAASKLMWKKAVHTQRCLIPAMGWYEWGKTQHAMNGNGKLFSQPYYIHSLDEGLITFAGLWSTWTSPEGDEIISCALLTKLSAPSIAHIHNRMPVVLSPDQWHTWFSPIASLQDTCTVMSEGRKDFTAHPVSTDVNNIVNDYPELLGRIETLYGVIK